MKESTYLHWGAGARYHHDSAQGGCRESMVIESLVRSQDCLVSTGLDADKGRLFYHQLSLHFPRRRRILTRSARVDGWERPPILLGRRRLAVGVKTIVAIERR